MSDGLTAAFQDRVQLRDAALKKLDVDNLLRAEDRHAVRRQLGHRIVTFAVATAGVFLLLLGIVALGQSNWTRDVAVAGLFGGLIRRSFQLLDCLSKVPVAEVCLTIVIIAGVVGTLGLRNRWLSSRYRAERLRSLGSQVLIRPEFWKTKPPSLSAWEEPILGELEEIEAIEPDGLKTVAEEEEATSILPLEATADTDTALLPSLAVYYLDQRLTDQLEYFRKLAHRQESWFMARVLGPLAFFGSIFFVGLHLLIDWARELAKDNGYAVWPVFQHVGGLLLFVSAAIPAAMIGVRTWRGANERARNVARSKAKLAVLEERAAALRGFAGAGPKQDPRVVFGTLALTENLLRNELQDWLRLMREAEWYG